MANSLHVEFIRLKNELDFQKDLVRKARTTLAEAEGADVPDREDGLNQALKEQTARQNALDAFVKEHPEYAARAEAEKAMVKKDGTVRDGSAAEVMGSLGDVGMGEPEGNVIAGSPHDVDGTRINIREVWADNRKRNEMCRGVFRLFYGRGIDGINRPSDEANWFNMVKRSSDPAGCIIERDGEGKIGEGIGGIQSQNGSESLEVAVAPGKNDS
jgi:hypothetical protein